MGMRLEIQYFQRNMSCKKGGFVSICHNNVRDLNANILKEVYNDAEVEPKLIPLTGEQLQYRSAITGEARLNIRVQKFLGERSRKIFSYKGFRPKG